jgi:MoaA/NifB/PqqE/SkfB family radical SAM enzyme
MGFLVQVGTNGTVMPGGFERMEGIDRYVLPLDAMDPRIHDMLRPHRPSHHALMLERLEALRASGKSVTISTLVTSRNLNEVVEVGDFLKRKDAGSGWVHAWHVYRFLPLGRGGERSARLLFVSEGAYDRLASEIRSRKWPFRIFFRKNMYRSRLVDFFWHEEDRLCRGSRVWKTEAKS